MNGSGMGMGMASVYICHVPEDRIAARQLAEALAGRGYRLFIDDDLDDAQRASLVGGLRQFDAIIVLWTSASAASQYVFTITAEAHRLLRLVPVRAAGLSPEEMAPDFGPQVTFDWNDIDGICRAIAGLEPPADQLAAALRRLSSEPDAPRREPPAPGSMGSGSTVSPKPRTEGIGAAAEPPRPPLLRPTSPPQDGTTITFGQPSHNKYSARSRVEGVGSAADPVRPSRTYFSDRESTTGRVQGVGAAAGAAPRAAPAPQQEALAAEAGRLVHKIPEKMWVGEQETVEVRLGRAAAEGLTQGLVGRGALSSQDIPILETMSVSIYTKGGAFDIERQSETTQLVSSDHLKGTAFEQADYGRWVWLVTPRKAGAQQLFVRVSASLKDSRGLPTSTSLPDREFPVSVAVDAGKTTMRFLRRGLLAAGGAVGAGLLGAITQELWWPKLKVLLQGWGWLG
jgi:TIR domain